MDTRTERSKWSHRGTAAVLSWVVVTYSDDVALHTERSDAMRVPLRLAHALRSTLSVARSLAVRRKRAAHALRPESGGKASRSEARETEG